MNRKTRRTCLSLGILAAMGCAESHSCRVRETAIPDAQQIHAEAPSLLPVMPVASTGPARGQTADPATQKSPIVQTGAFSNLPPVTGQVAVRIRASVNGMPILDQEVREALVFRMSELAAVAESQRASALQEMTNRELERLIERELVLQDAMNKIKEIKRPQLLEQLKSEAAKEASRRLAEIKKATKTTTDEEFAAYLAQNGLSVDGLRRQTERNFMMTEYIRNLIYPTVQRMSLNHVREFYEDNSELFKVPDRIKWLDIFIDASRFKDAAAARQHAELIAQRARAGEDFAALAKQFDNGDSVLRNGEGLGQKRGDIKPPIAETVLFDLKPGEVGPIIDLGFGFHIVKVVEREYAGKEPFDEKCQAKVREKLKGQIAEREYKRIVEDLKRSATIVVHKN